MPGSLISFKLHPNNPEYLLALVRSTECATLRNDKCSTDLYVSTVCSKHTRIPFLSLACSAASHTPHAFCWGERRGRGRSTLTSLNSASQDFGKNWQSLIANSKGRVTAFVDFEWGARMHPDPKVANYNEKTVFATVYETGDHAPHGFWDENINFVRSDDFFTTPHETTVKCGNAFEILAEKVCAEPARIAACLWMLACPLLALFSEPDLSCPRRSSWPSRAIAPTILLASMWSPLTEDPAGIPSSMCLRTLASTSPSRVCLSSISGWGAHIRLI